MDGENGKRQDIEEAIEALWGLSPIQVEVLTGIIAKFAEEQEREHLVLPPFHRTLRRLRFELQ